MQFNATISKTRGVAENVVLTYTIDSNLGMYSRNDGGKVISADSLSISTFTVHLDGLYLLDASIGII